MISLLIVLVFGCIAYIDLSSSSTTVFNWLLSLGGLSVIFTWMSVCFAHVRFRQAWLAQGHTIEELPFKAPLGVWGSIYGGVFNMLVLIANFYVAVWPIGEKPNANAFFLSYLAAPIILAYVSCPPSWLCFRILMACFLLPLSVIVIIVVGGGCTQILSGSSSLEATRSASSQDNGHRHWPNELPDARGTAG